MSKKDKLQKMGEFVVVDRQHPERNVSREVVVQSQQFADSLSIQANGKELLKEAIGEHLSTKRAEVIYWMRMIVERVEVMNRLITLSQKRLKLCHGQLAAIDKGQFYIDHKNQIVYEDDFLNTSWDSTATW
jgi:hypothetical protein